MKIEVWLPWRPKYRISSADLKEIADHLVNREITLAIPQDTTAVVGMIKHVSITDGEPKTDKPGLPVGLDLRVEVPVIKAIYLVAEDLSVSIGPQVDQEVPF